jgi:hypothetical protein
MQTSLFLYLPWTAVGINNVDTSDLRTEGNVPTNPKICLPLWTTQHASTYMASTMVPFLSYSYYVL